MTELNTGALRELAAENERLKGYGREQFERIRQLTAERDAYKDEADELTKAKLQDEKERDALVAIKDAAQKVRTEANSSLFCIDCPSAPELIDALAAYQGKEHE